MTTRTAAHTRRPLKRSHVIRMRKPSGRVHLFTHEARAHLCKRQSLTAFTLRACPLRLRVNFDAHCVARALRWRLPCKEPVSDSSRSGEAPLDARSNTHPHVFAMSLTWCPREYYLTPLGCIVHLLGSERPWIDARLLASCRALSHSMVPVSDSS